MNASQKIGALASFALAALAAPAAADYAVAAGGVKDAGTVSGRVVFNGTPPAPAMMKVDEDKDVCGADRPADDLIVGANKGIQNVVISIDSIAEGKDWELPATFSYDQKKCTFVPRIMVIRPEMEGVVLNSDTVGHNFHTISTGIYNINKKIQPDAKMVVAKGQIKKPGRIRAKCDIHSWMGGWWIVANTPYTVVTDKDGNFTISNVPAGSYSLKIWHEKLGESEYKVVVKKGETAKAEVSLKL